MCNRYNESKWNELDDTFMYGKKEGKKVGPTKKRTEENRKQKKTKEEKKDSRRTKKKRNKPVNVQPNLEVPA